MKDMFISSQLLISQMISFAGACVNYFFMFFVSTNINGIFFLFIGIFVRYILYFSFY